VSPDKLGPVELLGERHHLEGFDGEVAELSRWLLSSAGVAQVAGTAATYVLSRGEKVVGHYALTLASVAHESAPSRLRREYRTRCALSCSHAWRWTWASRGVHLAVTFLSTPFGAVCEAVASSVPRQ